MSKSGEKATQKVLWPEAAEGRQVPPSPPVAGEPMTFGSVKAGTGDRPVVRQLSLWDPVTGGSPPLRGIFSRIWGN